jgi:hypothetical protein
MSVECKIRDGRNKYKYYEGGIIYMAISSGSIKTWVTDAIHDIPTAVNSGNNIQDYVEKGIRYVENWTGDSISYTDIPRKYQTVVTNLGCAYTLARMMGTNVDFNIKLGTFTATKVPYDSPEVEQLNYYVNQANMDLMNLGRRAGNRYSKVT